MEASIVWATFFVCEFEDSLFLFAAVITNRMKTKMMAAVASNTSPNPMSVSRPGAGG